MSASIKSLLLAGSAALVLAACGGNIDSPGDVGDIIVNNPPPAPPPPPTTPPTSSADFDLVPGDCTAGTTVSTITAPGGATVEACVITGTVASDVTLDASIGYALDGAVFVGEDGGAAATLTIPAGTTVFGAGGEDYLVISRGSDIQANGTASDPVIFTSIQDITGTVDPVADRGLWGGLVINGSAPINDCIDATAAGGSDQCEKSGEGSSGLFGGSQSGDSSGTLRYVQVRYAGNLINDEDELNGIAFQGVGSGTTCEYVQVHNNADDGVEFFGGTVQCDYLVLTGIGDDSLDWTDGWQGGAQYVLVVQAADAGDRGIEADNRSSNNDLLPRSNPTIANFTLLGGAAGDTGAVLRAGTAGDLFNGIFVGWQDAGFDIDDAPTFDQVTAGELSAASHFFDNADNFEVEAGDPLTEADYRALPNIVTGNNTLTDRFFPGSAELNVTAADLSSVMGFDDVDYVGAFGPGESPDNSWATGWTFALGLDADPVAAGCPEGTTTTGDVVGGLGICSVSGTITSDVTLTNDFVYELNGPVFVGEDAGGDPAAPAAGASTAVLTIEAGTTVYGATGEDYLVVSRGSQLRSNGTSANPVTLTARADVFGTVDAATDRGLWGGLVINGRAPINDCIDATATGGSADCEKSGEGSSGLFGGSDPNDNSGTLFYTRVLYAGNLINDEDELNGIAFQGVGDGTTVDFVQVHNNADDGVEFFGGTVNASHLFLTGIGDDSVDWTDGYTGNIQYVIVDQSSDAGDRGIEADNRSSNNDLTPRSNPTVANITLVGGASGDTGAVLRAGTDVRLCNAVIAGWQDAGIDIDDGSIARAQAGGIILESILLDNTDNVENLDSGETFDTESFVASQNNIVEGASGVGDMDYVPGTEAAAVPACDLSGNAALDDVDYIGAVEDANDTWYVGWTLQVQQ